MNLKFPNFNFDTWCAEFTFLLDSLNRYHEDDLPTDSWIAEYTEKKEIFFAQNHLVFNTEEYDMCFTYLQYITAFNYFMSVVMNGTYSSVDHLVHIILLIRYPLLTSPVGITKALRSGKSFTTRYTITGPTLLFNPTTLSLIEKFINKHNIPILDDI